MFDLLLAAGAVVVAGVTGNPMFVIPGAIALLTFLSGLRG